MKYIPKIYKKNIFEIPYNKLKELGIKCLIFDLDNTLGYIDEKYPRKEVIELINEIGTNFDIYILSNNSHRERIDSYKDVLNCKAIHKAMKPFTKGIKKIIKETKYSLSEIAIIGDQVVTDIYAGSRAGIYTILVDPLAEKDLWVTKFNRIIEKHKLKKYKKKYNFERGKYYE